MKRRRFLKTCSVLGAGSLTGCLDGSYRLTSSISSGKEVKLEKLAGNLNIVPIDFLEVNDKYFVAGTSGKILCINDEGSAPKTALDLSSKVVASHGRAERGLHSFALHPEAEDNRKIYIRYTRRSTGPEEVVCTISEFELSPDFRHIDESTERVIYEVPHSYKIHLGISMISDDDNNLYIGFGQGGETTEEVLDLSSVWGTIIRISPSTGGTYHVPEDNPLIGSEGLDEIFAWGFRQPYSMSFNQGRLFVGDVGGNEGHRQVYEEVNLVEKGGNYGWPVKEGVEWICNMDVNKLRGAPWKILDPRYISDIITVKTDMVVCAAPFSPEYRDPVVVYPHFRNGERIGNAVIGGYLYQRQEVEALTDRYIFADLGGGMEEEGSRLFSATPSYDSDNTLWDMEIHKISNRKQTLGENNITALGQNSEGEVFVLSVDPYSEGGGGVYKISSSVSNS